MKNKKSDLAEIWYAHCCKYNQNQLKYDVKTFGPFTSIGEAINLKTAVNKNNEYDFIEITQYATLKMPELI